MPGPLFEEFAPGAGCGCPGCARERREAAARPGVRHGGHPGAHGARRALVLAAAASSVLASAPTAPPALAATDGPAASGHPAALDEPGAPDTPQGHAEPLGGAVQGTPGAPGAPAGGAATRVAQTTRAQILARAQSWLADRVPYSMSAYRPDGYRQDCSGFVSFAWNLGANQWTGSLASFGTRITKGQLQPGDMLLFHNPANPEKGSHVTIFGGWLDAAHTRYTAYEQTPPRARSQATPYAYWSNSARYVPYRPKNLADAAGGPQAEPGTVFPGADAFGPGSVGPEVTRLGEMLVARGGGRFYRQGPGPRWSDSDRQATAAFQRAQGWSGKDADGIPGARTWQYLVTGAGKDIPGGGAAESVPRYPGAGAFRPGQSNASVTRLGEQLVKKGYGRFYSQGPGPRWSESDRRATEAFQRAQGWSGKDADGYPGPETWRRLFS